MAGVATLPLWASVTVGNARFTPVTDRIIRCEWSADGVFEDRPSFTFVNRGLPEAPCTWERRGDGIVLKTAKATLEWTGGAFDERNLVVNGVKVLEEDTDNLLGTTRTLDEIGSLDGLLKVMEKGLFSRRGVTVVDDTDNPLFEKTDDHWKQWVVERRAVTKGAYRDLVVMAFGKDFRGGLKEYTDVAGKIPLPPRWAFGYWWSRYWLYTDKEVRDLVGKMKSIGVPLDVFVLDMEWHDTLNIGLRPDLDDEFGLRWGWTCYRWNQNLFPDPRGTLDFLHANGCKVPLNLHPAGGIPACDDCYGAFCRDYGWTRTTNSIPFRMCDRKWADCYFRHALGPLERDGVDFWWLDWQQWKTSRILPSVNVTFWLNHVFDAHMTERNGGRERPMIYHRWGGLGSHRYQVGFSGDSKSSWEMLAAIPWFTATASNVGYGYWGHDIGGHNQLDQTKPFDGELYVRWLQSGVFTPIFKTHPSKEPLNERRIWKYPEHVFVLRDALKLRYRLAPYVYTAAREAYDTGVSMCRPMYYDWPDAEAAYSVTNAYMFGNDILAATISRPMDPATQRASVDVWFPEGKWFDMSTGALIDGGSVRTLPYAIFQTPWFAKAGAVIPMYPESVDNLGRVGTDDLEFTFVPGEDRGECSVYEDDGVSADYARKGRWTKVVRDGTRITIGARAGAYTLRFPCLAAPEKVTVNGVTCGWTYDADEFAVVVKTPRQDGTRETVVELSLQADAAAISSRLYGLKGQSADLDELAEQFKVAIKSIHWAANPPDSWQRLWQFPARVAADPAELSRHLADRDETRTAFRRDLKKYGPKMPADFVRRLHVLMSAW